MTAVLTVAAGAVVTVEAGVVVLGWFWSRTLARARAWSRRVDDALDAQRERRAVLDALPREAVQVEVLVPVEREPVDLDALEADR